MDPVGEGLMLVCRSQFAYSRGCESRHRTVHCGIAAQDLSRKTGMKFVC